jgi:hypothetical protein
MDGLHLEGVPEDAREAFVSAQIGEPIPGEQTFGGDDETISLGGNGLEKRFRVRLHVPVPQRLTSLVEDADRHVAGMEIDATVKWVLRGVKSH